MLNISFSIFSFIRIFMFFMLSFYFLIAIDLNEAWKKGYIVIAMILFIITHIIQFSTERTSIQLLCNAFDFVLSGGFGFLFPKEGGLFYLIFYGVVSTTVFVKFEDKRILRVFTYAFIILWAVISYERYLVNGEFLIVNNILNSMFVFYGAIV